MTSPLKERRQQLHFSDDWAVVKWDKCPEFKQGIATAFDQLSGDGVKGADGIGVSLAASDTGSEIALVVEFKDYDHPDIPPRQRAQKAREAVSDELLQILVRKVIDTLCGATFSCDRQGSRSDLLAHWHTAIGSQTSRLLVLFCIEVPRTQAAAILPWTKKLQQRLHWLGPRANVIITSSSVPFSHAGVRYRVS